MPIRALIIGLFAWVLSASGGLAQDVLVISRPGAPQQLISAAQIRALPQQIVTTATPWTESATYAGPNFLDVLQLAGVMDGRVKLVAADDYTIELSLDELRLYPPILAWQRDGQPMPFRERGPYWLLFRFDETPALRNDLWYYRAIWHLVSVSVVP